MACRGPSGRRRWRVGRRGLTRPVVGNRGRVDGEGAADGGGSTAPASDHGGGGAPAGPPEPTSGGHAALAEPTASDARARRVVPRCTYRLQLNTELGFADAAEWVPYLARLGVSHLYLSPILQAAPGSTHGYDVTDHAHLSADLGGPGDYQNLCAVLAEHGMSQVLDVVPNHMATGADNAWWWDVLENGAASRWAHVFDIDWEADERHRPGGIRGGPAVHRLLVPALGDHYGRVLERGELRLQRHGGRFEIHYHEHRFPVAPRSVDQLLAEAVGRLEQDAAQPVLADLLGFLADALGSLPGSWRTDAAGMARRHRDKEVLAGLLEITLDNHRALAAAVDAVVARLNADHDGLDALIDRQNYRLAFWRSGAYELDYRRFFDVTTLIGLRMDHRPVFEDTHQLLLDLVRRGCVEGFRIDHPDGLANPAGYLQWLAHEAPQAWIVVEKILGRGETLPGWPVAGTTGYEFADLAGGLHLDPAGEETLKALHHSSSGDDRPYRAVELDAKRYVLHRMVVSDLDRLTAMFLAVCDADRSWRDVPSALLRRCLEEALVSMPNYRTYVVPGEPPHPTDRAVVRAAMADAAQRTEAELPSKLFGFLGDVLLGERGGERGGDLLVRFQQLSAPVMAKGVEDTAGYRYHLLGPLAEVGSDPGAFGVTVEEFHGHNEHVARCWPATMVGTSTHDTKRSEDVRARLSLLSEQAERWADTVQRWRNHPSAGGGAEEIDGWARSFVYEMLVGAHPLPFERAEAVLIKAMREAKLRTSWLDPDPDYETTVIDFLRGCYGNRTFMEDLATVAGRLVIPGRMVSLALVMAKLTSPGVADIYQGTEVWDNSLVDPDNRRPVALSYRQQLLASWDREVRPTLTEGGEVPPAWLDLADDTGRAKLHTIATALELRRRHPASLGAGGSYLRLAAQGPGAEHVVAWQRGGTGRPDQHGALVVAVTPRLISGLLKNQAAATTPAVGTEWADTTLSLQAGTWRDSLTGRSLLVGGGRSVELRQLLDRFPVALLVGGSGC